MAQTTAPRLALWWPAAPLAASRAIQTKDGRGIGVAEGAGGAMVASEILTPRRFGGRQPGSGGKKGRERQPAGNLALHLLANRTFCQRWLSHAACITPSPKVGTFTTQRTSNGRLRALSSVTI